MSDYPKSEDYSDLALFRTSDPPTSRTAAASVAPKLGTKRDQMLKAISEMCKSGQPPTANEAAARCTLLHGGISGTYRKRAGELIADNLLVESDARTCLVTKTEARTLSPNAEADAMTYTKKAVVINGPQTITFVFSGESTKHLAQQATKTAAERLGLSWFAAASICGDLQKNDFSERVFYVDSGKGGADWQAHDRRASPSLRRSKYCGVGENASCRRH